MSPALSKLTGTYCLYCDYSPDSLAGYDFQELWVQLWAVDRLQIIGAQGFT